jgi:hypothetical protein
MHHAGFRRDAQPGYRQTYPNLGHRWAWRQQGVGGPTRRVYSERSSLNLRQGDRTQVTGSSQLGEGIIMVGAVPCNLSSELHINGRHVFRAKDKSLEREAAMADAGRSTKHNRVVSVEG